jgi:hypothetical protein
LTGEREARQMRKLVAGVGVAVVATVGLTGTASAFHCTNVSRNANNPGAGAQVVIDANTDEIVDATKGVEKRVEQGLIDPATGEGYHGLVGLDFDGDGAADASTYIVTPNDVLPDPAMDNGPADHGINSF